MYMYIFVPKRGETTMPHLKNHIYTYIYICIYVYIISMKDNGRPETHVCQNARAAGLLLTANRFALKSCSQEVNPQLCAVASLCELLQLCLIAFVCDVRSAPAVIPQAEFNGDGRF